MVNDIEKDAVEVVYVKGYPSLAAFIASDHDKSTAIYRRFDPFVGTQPAVSAK